MCFLLPLLINEIQKIGLGRAWPFEALGEKQVHVSGPLLRNIGAKKHDWITLTVDLVNLASVRTTSAF